MKLNLNNLLQALILLTGEYRKGRDQVIAKGDPTDPNTGAVKSDEELIALFKGEAGAAVDKIDALIKKHGGGPASGGVQ